MERIGLPTLQHVNHFAAGGVVGGGGGAAPSLSGLGISPEAVQAMNGLGTGLRSFAGTTSTFQASVQTLQNAVNTFGTRTDALVSALQNLQNLHLTVEGRQTVEVIVNGAEVLSSLMPEIQQLIKEKTGEALRSTLKRHLPEAGVDYDA